MSTSNLDPYTKLDHFDQLRIREDPRYPDCEWGEGSIGCTPVNGNDRTIFLLN